MRLFGSEERIVAYEVRDSAITVQYCVQFEGVEGTKTACAAVDDAGEVVVVEGRSATGRYAMAIDPAGRIDRFEVQSAGCRWANQGLEAGHVSWVEFRGMPDRLALLDARGMAIFGEQLPSGLHDPRECL